MKTGTASARHDGFTLVEMVITLIVLGILAAIGAPSLRGFIVDLRVAGATSGFERVLRHARSEAVSRGRTVRICPSLDGWSCDPMARWHLGYISFVDLEGGPLRDGDDPVLRVRHRLKDLAIRFNGGDSVSVNALGRIGRNASMDFCASGGSHPGRRLVMIHSGRLRVESPAPGCRNL